MRTPQTGEYMADMARAHQPHPKMIHTILGLAAGTPVTTANRKS
jgi:hypothetical protein